MTSKSRRKPEYAEVRFLFNDNGLNAGEQSKENTGNHTEYHI